MGVALVLSLAVGVAKNWVIQDLTKEVLEHIKEKTESKDDDDEILENW